MFEQIENDGLAIEIELIELELKEQIVKAQIIYMSCFDEVETDGNFFADFCSYFSEMDIQILINNLNQTYGLQIDFDEFMRSYAVISNISINKYLFENLERKNNIDLAIWAENAYETSWGYVPETFGNVLYSEEYAQIKMNNSEITDDCDKWISLRTADNMGLLYSYLWFNTE